MGQFPQFNFNPPPPKKSTGPQTFDPAVHALRQSGRANEEISSPDRVQQLQQMQEDKGNRPQIDSLAALRGAKAPAEPARPTAPQWQPNLQFPAKPFMPGAIETLEPENPNVKNLPDNAGDDSPSFEPNDSFRPVGQNVPRTQFQRPAAPSVVPDSVMAGLRQGSYENSPEVSSYRTARDLETETSNRLFNTMRAPTIHQKEYAPTPGLRITSTTPPTGVAPEYEAGDPDPNEINALKYMMGVRSGNVAEHPLTQHAAEGEKMNEQLRAAQMAGFENPQAAAAYERQQAAEKMRQPLEVERIRGEYGVQQQRVQNQGPLDLQRSKFDQGKENFSILQNALGMAKPGQGMRAEGVGEFHNTQLPSGAFNGGSASRVPPAAVKQMNDSRFNYYNLVVAKGENAPETQAAKLAMETTTASTMAQDPEWQRFQAHPTIKTTVQDILNSHELANLSWPDILAHENGFDAAEFTPEEHAQIQALLSIARGH